MRTRLARVVKRSAVVESGTPNTTQKCGRVLQVRAIIRIAAKGVGSKKVLQYIDV
jgi:hypothetical protein